MVLMLSGLPPDISSSSVRRLIQKKCSVKHVMLDEMVKEVDGTQSVIIACMDQKDVGSIFTIFNGAKLGLYVLSVEMYSDGQPLSLNPLYQTSDDYSGNERRKKKEEQFEQLQSASSGFDDSFAGTPRIIPTPLMESAVSAPRILPNMCPPPLPISTNLMAPPLMAPPYQMAQHQITPLFPSMAALPPTDSPRFEMIQKKSLNQTSDDYSGNERRMKKEEKFEQLQSASSGFDDSFAGSPQIIPISPMESSISAPCLLPNVCPPPPPIPTNLMALPLMAPPYQMAQHQITPLFPSMAALPPTDPPRFEMIQKENDKPRPFTNRSLSEWDLDSGGVRKERSRGRSDILSPSRNRLYPERHRADHSSPSSSSSDSSSSDRPHFYYPRSYRPRSDRISSKRPRRYRIQRKRSLSPRPSSSKSSSKVARKEPEHETSIQLLKERVKLRSVIIRPTPTVHPAKQTVSLDGPATMNAVVFRVIESMLGFSIRRKVEPQFEYALEEAVKVRLLVILRTAKVKNDDHLFNLYMDKYPHNTNKTLVKCVCTMINADPKLVNEMLSGAAANEESCRAASAKIARHIIDPKISSNGLVPPDEKVLFTNLSQIIYEMLKNMVKLEKFVAPNAELLVDSYWAKYSSITASLVYKALLRGQTCDPNFTYRGKFSKQVKQQLAELDTIKASEPAKSIPPKDSYMVPQSTIKASEPKNVVPQSTTKASEPKNLVPQTTTKASEPKKSVPQSTTKASEPKKLVPQSTTKACEPKKLVPQSTTKASEPKNLVPQSTTKASEPKNLVPQSTTNASEPKNLVPEGTTNISEPNNLVPQNHAQAGVPYNLDPQITTEQKSQPPQQLFQKWFPPKLVSAIIKELTSSITDEMVNKAMSSVDPDAKVNNPNYLQVKERLTDIFSKRLDLLLKRSKPKLPGTLDELKQMYNSAYKESDDARLSAIINRILNNNNDTSTTGK